MSKDKLLKGMVVGAIVGGLLTLTDKDTRKYVKESMQNCSKQATFYMQHPTEAFHQLNVQYNYYSKQVSSSLTTVLGILNQLQNATKQWTEKDRYE